MPRTGGLRAAVSGAFEGLLGDSALGGDLAGEGVPGGTRRTHGGAFRRASSSFLACILVILRNEAILSGPSQGNIRRGNSRGNAGFGQLGILVYLGSHDAGG